MLGQVDLARVLGDVNSKVSTLQLDLKQSQLSVAAIIQRARKDVTDLLTAAEKKVV